MITIRAFSSFFISLLIGLFAINNLNSQISSSAIKSANKEVVEPVIWSIKVKKISEDEFDLIFKAKVSENWAFYSQYSEGVIPLDFGFDSEDGFEVIGNLKESPKPKEEYNKLLDGLIKYWDKEATLSQRIKMTSTNKTVVKGYINYQSCTVGIYTLETYEFSIEIQATKITSFK